MTNDESHPDCTCVPAVKGLRGGVWLAVMLLGVLLGTGRAQAQAVKGQIISVGIGGTAHAGQNGLYREGCWVPVQVRLKNMTGQPFVGHLAVDQDLMDLDGDKILCVGPKFTLAPGVEERTLWTYYWPRPDYAAHSFGITRVVVLNDAGSVVPGGTLATSTGLPQSEGIPPVGRFERDHSSRFVVILGSSAAGWDNYRELRGGTESVVWKQVNAAGQLPDHVLGYDGVDVIVWEADRVKVSDIPPEFQLRAMLAWVRAGGHLIITVGAQGQEFAKAGAELQAALPLAITGTRDLGMSALSRLGGFGGADASQGSLVQATGQLKPGARRVIADPPGSGAPFADHPLVVTGLFGQGAVTLVTIDMSAPDAQHMNGMEWVRFWNQAAGWRQNQNFYTDPEFKRRSPQAQEQIFSTSPLPIHLGERIEQDVDVTDVTAVRILVALAFLALYWLIAGPLGHLVLRQYRLTHWSWWIFGGTVVVATAVAGAVVLVLHVNAYDVRHRSFVIGTVNSPEATVASYYGIYAPSSGPITLAQPATAGMNYLTPMCLPREEDVKSFADPQSYRLDVEGAHQVAPVFRVTLKKLQSRWAGSLPGITGTGAYASASTDLRHLLDGTLKNDTGYDLRDATVLVYLPPETAQAANRGSTYLFHLNDAVWKQGAAVNLASGLTLDLLEAPAGEAPGTVEMALQAIGWKYSQDPGPGGFGSFRQNWMEKVPQMTRLQQRPWRQDLLYLLGDTRNLDDLAYDDRRELVRGMGRLTDCTKALRAAGALIIAHAEGVKNPVPLEVNGKSVKGRGDVQFAWALPLTGAPPRATMVPAPAGPTPLGNRTLIEEAP